MNDLRSKVVIVYVPMKVGSTSLVSSIRLSGGEEYSVLHVHNDESLKLLTGKKIKITELIKKWSEEGKKIYVMDVYRSPIERKMSCYFEWMEYHWNKKEEEIKKIDMEKLKIRFNDLFRYLGEEDYLKEKYELEECDIPSKFSHDKKYIHIKKGNIEYIKLRLKDWNIWWSILSEILGRRIVTIKDHETSEKMNINSVYERFKKEYKIPVNYLEEIKASESLNYYYTKEEVVEYINSWEVEEAYIGLTRSEYDLYSKISLENWNGKSMILNHYKDSGCICNLCSKKRKEVYSRIISGELTNERIIHEEVVERNRKEIMKKVSALSSSSSSSSRKVDIRMKFT